MNSKLRAILLPLLRTVKAGKPPSFRNRSAAEQAIFLIQKQRAPTARKKPARERKIAKAATHREETARIREAVFLRAGGYCELGDGALEMATELHHLEGGSGRRALQRASNCMAVCFYCHRGFHDHPEDYRPIVLAWCARHGYPIPRRFRRPQLLPAPAAPGLNPPEAVGAAGAAEKEEG